MTASFSGQLETQRGTVDLTEAVITSPKANGPSASGDGWKSRGIRLILVTGKDNYQKCGDAMGLDLVRSPELLEQPHYAALAAGWFWAVNGLNTLADVGGIANIGRIVNTGKHGKVPNGADDRMAIYQRALTVRA